MCFTTITPTKISRFILLLLLAYMSTQAFASGGDPLDLSGGPSPDTKAAVPTEPEKALYSDLLETIDLAKDPQDKEKYGKGMARFDRVIKENPEYADAHLLRAMFLSGITGPKPYARIIEDISSAIEKHPKSIPQSTYADTAGMYGMRAKIYKTTGNLAQAIKDLSIGINTNYRDAIERSSGEPSELQWSKQDFDDIVKKYPKDCRGYFFRAVYVYKQSILMQPEEYQAAVNDLNKAIKLNPKYALAHYLLGSIADQKIVWGKKTKEDYSREAQVMALGQSVWMAHPKESNAAVSHLTSAIKKDPRMVRAYSSRAAIYLNTMQYALAVKDYDKVLQLDTDDGSSYHDRGLAYLKLGQYWRAIDDFTHSMDAKKKVFQKYQAYLNRATAYAENGNLEKAVADYAAAISMHTGEVVILMKLGEFRSIYPEYDNLDDNALLEKLHAKYYPNMEFKGFASLILDRKGDWWTDMSGSEMYEKRGDAYLKFGHYEEAIADYVRTSRIWPDYHMDRWKYLFDTAKAHCYLDITTIDKKDNVSKFWLKNEYSKKMPNSAVYSIQSMALDCSAKKLRVVSLTEYSNDGNPIYSDDSFSEWNAIIPDTIGESLFNGWCSR